MTTYCFDNLINKSYIEQFASQEQLFYRLCGIEPKAGKLFKSPFREEKRASCSFYKSKSGDVLFRDFGEGKSYSWITMLMKKYNLTYYKAIKFAAKELGLSHEDNIDCKPVKLVEIPKIEENITILQVQTKEFTSKELRWWKMFGIEQETLKKFNVYSIQTVFLNGTIIATSSDTNPIYGYYLGYKNDCEIWKIYFPLSKNRSYRFLTNGKDSVIQGWKQLIEHGDFVVITKSMKDLMLYHQFDIPAIAPNSENVFLSESKLNELEHRFKYIIVHFDNDLPGIKAMQKLKKQYPQFKYVFIPRSKSKDLSDYCKFYGIEETKKLLENAQQSITKSLLD